MTVPEFFAALNFFLGVAFLIWFAYGPWQDLLVDQFRQKVFNVREELFDAGLAGEVQFESADYQRTRDFLNTAIRFAHQANWIDVLFANVTAKLSHSVEVEDAKSDLLDFEDVPEEERKVYLRALGRSTIAITMLIVLRSPLLLLIALGVVLPIALIALLYNLLRHKVIRDIYEFLDATLSQEQQQKPLRAMVAAITLSEPMDSSPAIGRNKRFAH